MSKVRKATKSSVKINNKNKTKGRFAKKNAPKSKAKTPVVKKPSKKKGKSGRFHARYLPAAPAANKDTRVDGQSTTKRKHIDDSSDNEDDLQDMENFEKRPRLEFKKTLSENVEDDPVDEEENPEISHEDHHQSSKEEKPKELPLIEVIALKKKTLQENRVLVGSTCVSILSNPQENIERLKPLLALMDNHHNDPVSKLTFFQTQQLLAYSILEVFRDIIPSYRIREKTTEDDSKRIKKETKDLRTFETSLMKYYKIYLSKMIRMVECTKKKKKSHFYDDLPLEKKEEITATGLRCLATLVVSHPHFNLRDQILDVIVPLMSSKISEIREIAFEYVTRLFREDKSGHVSHIAVKAAGKVIKALKMNVHPMVIKSFLHLNIKEVKKRDETVDMTEVRAKLSRMSKKEKRHNKQMSKLRNELKEVEANEDQNKKIEVHTQILNTLFFVYFRFMKDFLEASDDDVYRHSIVLTPVLEGLSKFAHLINIDFFDDIISILFRLLVSHRTSPTQTLFVLNTVFTILSGEGSSLSIDPQRFYGRLYEVLNKFDVEKEHEGHFQAIHDCLDQMLFKRKKSLTLARVLAFCKRLATVCLTTSPNVAIGHLAHLRVLLQDHPKADLLLDTDNFGTGKYHPEVEDPEFSHADATRLWELHVLRKHVHPLVAKFANVHLNRSRNAFSKSDLGMRQPMVIFEEVLQNDDLEKLFEDSRIVKSVKKSPKYSIIDTSDSLYHELAAKHLS